MYTPWSLRTAPVDPIVIAPEMDFVKSDDTLLSFVSKLQLCIMIIKNMPKHVFSLHKLTYMWSVILLFYIEIVNNMITLAVE